MRTTGLQERTDDSLTRIFLPNYMLAIDARKLGMSIPGDISDDEPIMVSGTELVLNRNNEPDVKPDGQN